MQQPGPAEQLPYRFVDAPARVMLCDMDSDERLMQRYQRGDSRAFDELYQRYRGDVYRFLLRQFDAQTAEELYQEVWMKVINARERYTDSARFRTWLYSITHNHLRDHWRRQHARQHEAERDVEPRNELGPETVVRDRQALQVLLEGVRLLPDEQRDAFLLKVESGLSLDEIAEVMQSNRESTKSRLRYAMKKLREHLKGIWP